MADSIILIGFMGAGKTTVGKIFAQKEKIKFVDTDEEIEKEMACSIDDIFRDKGEEAFRDMETSLLKKLSKCQDDLILSVGGGLPLRQVNQDLMHSIGQVVYLRASMEAIYERVREDRTRPLLRGTDLKEKIRTLMNAREACYEACADRIIDTDNLSPVLVADFLRK